MSEDDKMIDARKTVTIKFINLKPTPMHKRMLSERPYGDNLVARCDDCGKAIHLCTCEGDEDDEFDHEDDRPTKGEIYEYKNGLYEDNIQKE